MSRTITTTMTSIIGVATATAVGIAPPLLVTSPMTSSDTKTSTNTEAGAPYQNTERFGSRTRPSLVGRLIATATGPTLRRGAGRGWMTHPGALLRSTTGAG